jgi:hypothetical protein
MMRKTSSKTSVPRVAACVISHFHAKKNTTGVQ